MAISNNSNDNDSNDILLDSKKQTKKLKRRQHQHQQHRRGVCLSKLFYFLLGCIVSSIVIFNYNLLQQEEEQQRLQQFQSSHIQQLSPLALDHSSSSFSTTRRIKQYQNQQQFGLNNEYLINDNTKINSNSNNHTNTEFSNLKILVAIVAYDFSQVPHLEQVLDSYSDLAITVQYVHVIIYTTVPWPVTYIDMMQTRFLSSSSSKFQITIQVFSPSLRLYLVNEHKHYFYENVEEYDLFIYTEDDIIVPPTTVATYYYETKKLHQLLLSSTTTSTSSSTSTSTTTPTTTLVRDDEINPKSDKKKKQRQRQLQQLKQRNTTDYNIGIVRYEYQYPVDWIDDSTRHVTQNVSRIYWEHLQDPPYEPLIPVQIASSTTPTIISNENGNFKNQQHLQSLQQYVTMKNHHQGMYIATRELLLAWKYKDNCEYHIPKNRPHAPGKPGQPSEGTQRVWISSNQLYGKRHCNVLQVLPINAFGALTVWHVPNKNYRRLGKKGRIGYGYHTGIQDQPAMQQEQEEEGGTTSGSTTTTTSKIPNALQVHLELRKLYPGIPTIPYKGIITMEDHVHGLGSNAPLLTRRMREYYDYVERGGILSPEDFTRTELIEDA